MKILLTGGTGFLGKNFISKNYNNKRYQIFSIQRKKSNNNKNTNYISCDLNNKKKLISVINDINPYSSFTFHGKVSQILISLTVKKILKCQKI